MKNGLVRIYRALLSVSDKSRLGVFAKALNTFDIEILSTGGTARELRAAGLEPIDVSEYTGFPEMLDGRVKTLHPKVHGGLLYIRGNPIHEDTVAQHSIKPIDMVVVNLYPFSQTVAKPTCTFADAIENIDIGGPSMLRSAAKNHDSVTVIVDPLDYEMVLAEMQANGGCTSLKTRRELARKAFRTTAIYDTAIADYLDLNPV